MDTLIHKLLFRQLTREGLSYDVAPEKLSQWQHFIERVNNTYNEADQERYLLERSMKISSDELTNLKERLESAQHIAKLGYWSLNPITDDFFCSKELYSLFEIDLNTPLSWDKFLQLIHKQDRQPFEKLVETSLRKGIRYECEVRITTYGGNELWFYMAGQPFQQTKHGDYELSGIVMDITTRKKTQEKIDSLQEKLLMSARQAGMADVATSVLHNVGNILNSANVSLELLQENLSAPYHKKLFTLRDMLKNHIDSLPTYLTQDTQGSLIPKYFIAMTDIMEANYLDLIKELTTLNEHVTHIKEIIVMQQGLFGTSGIIAKFSLPEVIDTALQMCGSGVKQKNIEIIKNYNEMPFLVSDKNKLLQILVNIIQNAKDSVSANTSTDNKKIMINIDKFETNKIKIAISDNGIGIPPENFQKIFSFGFTTKKSGHGFGLHSCALAAGEIGGKLEAKNTADHQGAVFSLILPLEN